MSKHCCAIASSYSGPGAPLTNEHSPRNLARAQKSGVVSRSPQVGEEVGAGVGAGVGAVVGARVGDGVGDEVGADGAKVGNGIGAGVGWPG